MPAPIDFSPTPVSANPIPGRGGVLRNALLLGLVWLSVDAFVNAPAHGQSPAIDDAEPLEWTAPTYSEVARRARIQGQVRVELTLDPQGRVGEAHTTADLPFGLSENTLRAVRTWRFAPSLLPSRRTEIAVRFAIDPADQWRPGAAFIDPRTLSVWTVFLQWPLQYGLAHGTSVPLRSPAGLDIAETVFRHLLQVYGIDASHGAAVLALGGKPPGKAFFRRFADSAARVLPASENGYVMTLDLRRIARSPSGETVVGDSRDDIFGLELAGGAWVVTEEWRRVGCLMEYTRFQQSFEGSRP